MWYLKKAAVDGTWGDWSLIEAALRFGAIAAATRGDGTVVLVGVDHDRRVWAGRLGFVAGLALLRGAFRGSGAAAIVRCGSGFAIERRTATLDIADFDRLVADARRADDA